MESTIGVHAQAPERELYINKMHEQKIRPNIESCKDSESSQSCMLDIKSGWLI